jgi:hypothetical protein
LLFDHFVEPFQGKMTSADAERKRVRIRLAAISGEFVGRIARNRGFPLYFYTKVAGNEFDV